MPYVSPLRPCLVPGCRNLTDRGIRCVLHRLEAQRARESSTQRGYDHGWRKKRARVLTEEASCRACDAPADPEDHVDHIVPKARGGTDDRENLQRLCRACHARKTLRENR